MLTLDRTNGLGVEVSYGELIPSGSIIHIGVKGGYKITNGNAYLTHHINLP